MDDDDAVPPPIRRSSRAALERQTAADDKAWADGDDIDEAAPVVPRSRSASLESGPSPQSGPPPFNPLAAHPISLNRVTNFSRHRFSGPFREELPSPPAADQPPQQPTPPPVPRRSPARLKSFRSNKRVPLHLQRRTSLETIDSVTTSHSIPSDEDEPDPPEATAPSPDFFTLQDDPATTPVPSDAHSLASSVPSSHTSSQRSFDPPKNPTPFRETEPNSPKAFLWKMTHRKSDGPSVVPDRLIIEKKVSFERTSHRPRLYDSNQSLPSERPVDTGLFDVERSRSGSSSEWSASIFDIANLTESELKKCKKKGINPSLYAEMKAARKGKWASPIAGNTFL